MLLLVYVSSSLAARWSSKLSKSELELQPHSGLRGRIPEVKETLSLQEALS